MKSNRTFTMLATMSIVAFAAPFGGCDKKSESSKPATAGTSTQKDPPHQDGDGHPHGATTHLGEQSAGGFTVKASRDGDIVAGKDAAIDVWVTPAGAGAAQVTAVRFWIGTQDAKGSVKAKAELEKDNWHTHAEIPSPLPAGSRLWVEVETGGGSKAVVGFDLRL